jgi:uncharacterized protein
MIMKLTNSLILITGASSGIGAATAQAAARRGARLILLARSADKLARLVAEISQSGGSAHAFAVDLTDPQAVSASAARITSEVGTPDVVINNAGVGRWLFTDETPMAEAADMIAAPYLAAFYTTRAFLPVMLNRNSGVIVNLTSIAGHMAWPGATAYTAGRWAMRGFNAGLRADLHGTRVRTMLVTFAKVQSDYWAHNHGSEERVPSSQKLIPTLTAEQAADAIVRGLEHNQSHVSAPFMLGVILTLNYLFPFVTRWLLASTGYRRATTPAA